MLEKIVSLAVDSIEKINLNDYSDEEFAIARMGFLSTRPNSHGLIISEDVLRKSAPSVLNKWVVADMVMGEPTTHTKKEHIVGRIPKSQDVEFVVDEDGYLRAYVDTVISKIYAKDFCAAFEQEKTRAVSVEMKVLTEPENDNIVDGFTIVGVTVLGRSIKPSCPQSDIEFVRFSEEKANEYFEKRHITALQKFVQEREVSMAKYKIDKSKEAMSTKAWGDVDKEDLRNKIMDAENKTQLVKACYMIVEDGWEDAPSQHLKYPVMNFEGDTLVYNRYGLASALAYAKQEGESAVINKVEKIYKKLGLDDSDGKEEKKMSEIEFAAVNISDLWCSLYRAMENAHEWEFCIHGIYEEGNQKFAIVCDRDKKLYRLDFSLTEEGLTLADEIVEVKEEFVETENMKKFAEPENVADYRFAESEPEDEEENDDDVDEKEEKMSEDEMMAKISELQSQIEEKENIIMNKDKDIADKDAELEELRQFKAGIEEKEKATAIEKVLSDVNKFLEKDAVESFRQEGLAVEFAQLDAWANKVKASVVDKVVNSKSKQGDVFSFSAPIEQQNKRPESVWDRI